MRELRWKNSAWLRNAQHANAGAARLAAAVADIEEFSLMFPVEANAVFLRSSADRLESLRQRGWQFYTFIGGGARFMFAWDADPARVDALARDIREVSGGRTLRHPPSSPPCAANGSLANGQKARPTQKKKTPPETPPI